MFLTCCIHNRINNLCIWEIHLAPIRFDKNTLLLLMSFKLRIKNNWKESTFWVARSDDVNFFASWEMKSPNDGPFIIFSLKLHCRWNAKTILLVFKFPLVLWRNNSIVLATTSPAVGTFCWAHFKRRTFRRAPVYSRHLNFYKRNIYYKYKYTSQPVLLDLESWKMTRHKEVLTYEEQK